MSRKSRPIVLHPPIFQALVQKEDAYSPAMQVSRAILLRDNPVDHKALDDAFDRGQTPRITEYRTPDPEVWSD